MKILFLSDFLPTKEINFHSSFVSLLEGADRIVFNLEGSPLTNSDLDRKKQIMPFQLEDLFSFLNRFGKDKFVIALANNHILDNGYYGFDYLIEQFQKYNITYFGTKKAPYITLDNEVSILNFVTAETVAHYSSKNRLNYLFYNSNKIRNQIKILEASGRKLIMYPHWGRDLDQTQFETYRLNKENDKWQVFGHHPHVISGIYENEIYSMGNSFIPHPNYYKRFPAVCYGLALIWDTDETYDIYQTKVISNDEFVNNFELVVTSYESIPQEVLEHGSSISGIKEVFFKIFSFKGNPFDWVKMWLLQGMSLILDFRRKSRA